MGGQAGGRAPRVASLARAAAVQPACNDPHPRRASAESPDIRSSQSTGVAVQ